MVHIENVVFAMLCNLLIELVVVYALLQILAVSFWLGLFIFVSHKSIFLPIEYDHGSNHRRNYVGDTHIRGHVDYAKDDPRSQKT